MIQYKIQGSETGEMNSLYFSTATVKHALWNNFV